MPCVAGKVWHQNLIIKTPLDASVIDVRVWDVVRAQESLPAILADKKLSLTLTLAEVIKRVGAVGGCAANTIQDAAGTTVSVGRAVPFVKVRVVVDYLTLKLVNRLTESS